MRNLSLQVIVLLTACSQVTEQATEPQTASLGPSHSFEQRLERAFRVLSARKVPVIVEVVHDGVPTVREFGALRDDGIDARETLVDLNSITKTITAIMIAKLADEGKIRLDETLGEIFVEVPSSKRAITVHQLLTHTAGFRESLGDDAEVLTRDEFLRRAFEARLVTRPGARYHYSNVGFGLLAAAIEQKTGTSYESTLRDLVLRDHAVPSIGYEAAYEDARSMRSARGETIRQASWGGHAPSWNLIGNGGLVSTVPDFVRLRRLLQGGHIVSEERLRALHAPHVAEDDSEESFYGYGVVVQELEPVGRVLWHDGGNDVFSAVWAEYVDRGDLIVTAAADSRRGDAFEAMEILTAELYDAAP